MTKEEKSFDDQKTEIVDVICPYCQKRQDRLTATGTIQEDSTNKDQLTFDPKEKHEEGRPQVCVCAHCYRATIVRRDLLGNRLLTFPVSKEELTVCAGLEAIVFDQLEKGIPG